MLFAGDDLLIHEEVPDRFRALRALREPVRNAFFVQLKLGGVEFRLVQTEIFESLAPRIASFFAYDHAVRRLLVFPNAGKTDGQHGGEFSEMRSKAG